MSKRGSCCERFLYPSLSLLIEITRSELDVGFRYCFDSGSSENDTPLEFLALLPGKIRIGSSIMHLSCCHDMYIWVSHPDIHHETPVPPPNSSQRQALHPLQQRITIHCQPPSLKTHVAHPRTLPRPSLPSFPPRDRRTHPPTGTASRPMRRRPPGEARKHAATAVGADRARHLQVRAACLSPLVHPDAPVRTPLRPPPLEGGRASSVRAKWPV